MWHESCIVSSLKEVAMKTTHKENSRQRERNVDIAKDSSKQRGQGLTEYIILVGIIAIGSMFVVSKFGESIKTVTGNMVNVFTDQKTNKKEMGEVSEAAMQRTSLWQSINRDPSKQR
jgi:hypothetical protein